MNRKNWVFMVFILVIFAGFLAPSCAKKDLKTETTMSEEEARRQAEEEARRRELERQAAGVALAVTRIEEQTEDGVEGLQGRHGPGRSASVPACP